MDTIPLRAARLRSHRLSAPAPTLASAAEHMLAIQAQEFWGGRWAVAARTRGEPRLSDVDAALDRGRIVRSWTMRGTLHLIAPRDLEWVLSLTGERQRRQAGAVHRAEGIDDAEVLRAERLLRAALAGGGRLSRAEVFAVLEAGGVVTAKQRGYHLLTSLATRAVIVQGPVVQRSGAPTREQAFVLVEDWVTDAASPADPLAEFFVRFIASHGPAGPADFAWWAGLPVGLARDAAEGAGDRVTQIEDGLFIASGSAPRRNAAAHRVVALPPFEEYYLSYADRTAACSAEFTAVIGPSINGIIRPVLVADGEIIGVWSHSVAVGRHAMAPVAEVFAPAALADAGIAASDVDDALARFSRFITG